MVARAHDAGSIRVLSQALSATLRAVSAVASTTLGWLQGEERPGLLVFRGVPYAQPPVGALRFRAPVPALAWSGTRDATRPGPTSLQVLGMMRDLEPQDEDCLRLNVWTTRLNGRRPV